VDPVQTLAWIKKYFGPLPKRPTPQQPDISEPRQEKEKRAVKADLLATRPALAASWHMPARNTPEYYAMGLIDQILVQGKDSRLSQSLVQDKGLTGEVAGGINLLGHQFNVSGPVALDVYVFHDKDKTLEQILAAVDAEVQKLQTTPVDKATLDRARVKVRSALYDAVDGFFGFGRADLLASYALFDDDPAKINSIEAEFAKVTPELIQKAAREYLRTTNRTVLTIDPRKDEKPADAAAPAGGGTR
jgi:predicted Zn-dependent peptidase